MRNTVTFATVEIEIDNKWLPFITQADWEITENYLTVGNRKLPITPTVHGVTISHCVGLPNFQVGIQYHIRSQGGPDEVFKFQSSNNGSWVFY